MPEADHVAKLEAELAAAPLNLKSVTSDGHSVAFDTAALEDRARRARRAKRVASGRKKRVRGINLSNVGLG